jgi:hypothetical protein
MSIELRSSEPRPVLPPAPKPAGNYAAAVRVGNLLFIAGQFPIENGKPKYSSRVGTEHSRSGRLRRRATRRIERRNDNDQTKRNVCITKKT